MRALITGGGGFVGPYLRMHLEAMGDEVAAFDSEVDVTKDNIVRSTFNEARPDVVYHLAAASHVGASWSAPTSVVNVNTCGALNVMLAAVETGVKKFVLIGSAAEYGCVSEDLLPIVEDTPLRPQSPYGASKAAAEMMASYVMRGLGLPVVCVRAFNHIGPGQSSRFVASALAQQVARNEQKGGTEVLVGDTSSRRDFTDVRDVVRAYRLIAEYGLANEAYNVCSANSTSVLDLANMYCSLTAVPMRLVVDTDRVPPVDVPVLVGDYTKLRDHTAWFPQIPLLEAVSDVLNWWRQQPNL